MAAATKTWPPNSGRWRISTGCAGDGDRDRFRDQLFAGPSLRPRASRLVLPAPGRDDQIRGESAEEISGRVSDEFSQRGLARDVGGTDQRDRILVRARGAHLSRGQSTHEAGGVLGL